MKYKFMTLLTVPLLALLITTWSALAAGSDPHLTVDQEAGRVPASACAKLEAGDVTWVTLTDSGDIDQQVTSYPSGVSRIHAFFTYTCVPPNTTIVSVFSLEGQTVVSFKDTLRPSTTAGQFDTGIHTKDDSPLDEGSWAVAFFNNKSPLTSGQVQVGGTVSSTTTTTTTTTTGTSATVIVKGTVTDARSRKPIAQATIIILNPGVTPDQYLDRGQLESDVFTVGETESTGQFTLPRALPRNTSFSVIAGARGYKLVGANGLSFDNNQPDPAIFNISLNRE